MTNQDMPVTRKTVSNYLYALVNRFYKILPMKESGEPTLSKYISSLKREMIGCLDLINGLNDDGRFLTLLASLEYLERHHMNDDVSTVRSEIFRCIGVIKQLRRQYGSEV